jgi:hypothetical protein
LAPPYGNGAALIDLKDGTVCAQGSVIGFEEGFVIDESKLLALSGGKARLVNWRTLEGTREVTLGLFADCPPVAAGRGFLVPLADGRLGHAHRSRGGVGRAGAAY